MYTIPDRPELEVCGLVLNLSLLFCLSKFMSIVCLDHKGVYGLVSHTVT
jgi:hypothetical protein